MPHRDIPELSSARQLWARELYEEAIAIFDQCAAKHPRNSFALIDAARAAGQWFDFPKMEQYLARLLRLSERKPEKPVAGRNDVSDELPAGRSQTALAAGSIVLAKTAFLANLELAVLCERQGLLQEAEDHARRALLETPNSPEATLVLARVLVRTDRAGEAVKRLADRSQRGENVHPDTRAAALALLARQCERDEQFDEAFSLAVQSKEVLRPLVQTLPAQIWEKDEDITGFYDGLKVENVERLLGWQPNDDGQRVCLMASFPRSGTTLLEAMLGTHPDVHAADEFPVFVRRLLRPLVRETGDDPLAAAERLANVDEQQLSEHRATYLQCHGQLLQAELGGTLLVDKNPSYTVFFPFFLRLFPEIKLLVPLRDPRDVVLSCFFQYLPVNPWSAHFMDLETAAKRFARVMRHWIRLREMAPASSWHEVKYERLVENPDVELRRTCGFLNLPWNEDALAYHTRQSVVVHNAPTYADVRRAPHRAAIGRWQRYENRISPLRKILEPVMQDLGYAW